MSEKVIAVVQARMASSRLPGKVLMNLGGMPVLGRTVARSRLARGVDEVVLATTTEKSDDAVADYCTRHGIHIVRGSHFDVLDRYHKVALETRADTIVRITADCPLIDPGLIEDAVSTLEGGGLAQAQDQAPTRGSLDLVANRLPPPWRRTYPIGLDIEVCTFGALDRAWHEAKSQVDREHVMPYLYHGVELAPQDPHLEVGTSRRGFRIAVMHHSEDLGTLRWTVDTAEDLEFVCQVYGHFGTRGDFSWLEVLQLLRSKPELAAINAAVQHKTLSDTDSRAKAVAPE